VRKMVEAVWGKESRESNPASHPARAARLADSTQRDQQTSIFKSPDPAPNAKLRKAIASLAPPRGGRKAKTRE
jgi:hypothetical protein